MINIVSEKKLINSFNVKRHEEHKVRYIENLDKDISSDTTPSVNGYNTNYNVYDKLFNNVIYNDDECLYLNIDIISKNIYHHRIINIIKIIKY